MMKLTYEGMENTFGNTGFVEEFDDFEGAAVTLGVIVLDGSTSMDDFESTMPKYLENSFLKRIKQAQIADRLRLCKVIFTHRIPPNAFERFVSPENLDCSYQVGGGTAIYSTWVWTRDALFEKMDKMRAQKVRTNAVVYMMTDGRDEHSHENNHSLQDGAAAVKDLLKREVELFYFPFGASKITAELLGIPDDHIIPMEKTEAKLKEIYNIASSSLVSKSQLINTGLGATSSVPTGIGGVDI